MLPRAPAQVSFSGIRVRISNVPLDFLFNFIAAIAASPIQSAITQQVAQQVRLTWDGCTAAVLQDQPVSSRKVAPSASVSLNPKKTLPHWACVST